MAYVAICNDEITVLAENPLVQSCSSGWINVLYVPPFDPSQVDISVCLSMLAAGITLYATPWAISYGAGLLLNFLRGR